MLATLLQKFFRDRTDTVAEEPDGADERQGSEETGIARNLDECFKLLSELSARMESIRFTVPGDAVDRETAEREIRRMEGDINLMLFAFLPVWFNFEPPEFSSRNFLPEEPEEPDETADENLFFNRIFAARRSVRLLGLNLMDFQKKKGKLLQQPGRYLVISDEKLAAFINLFTEVRGEMEMMKRHFAVA